MFWNLKTSIIFVFFYSLEILALVDYKQNKVILKSEDVNKLQLGIGELKRLEKITKGTINNSFIIMYSCKKSLDTIEKCAPYKIEENYIAPSSE